MKKENLNEAEKTALQQGVVSTSTFDEPYCTDCGNEDLAYLDQYANGEYWKCKECGKQFIHKIHKED